MENIQAIDQFWLGIVALAGGVFALMLGVHLTFTLVSWVGWGLSFIF
jgi:hypothetical protein